MPDTYTTEVTYQHWSGVKTVTESFPTLRDARESAVADLLYHLERMEAIYSINVLLDQDYYQYLIWLDDGFKVLFTQWGEFTHR